MKRSEINNAIEYVVDKCKDFNLPLPPFAYYSPEKWTTVGENEKEIVDNMLGWDVTDFGTGKFDQVGLTVFVFRNGNFNNSKEYPKPYCEKLLYVKDGQILPFHFHWNKTEDIINRGGGEVEITLYQSDESETFLEDDVVISMDGKKVTVPAGGKIVLHPGESVTLSPYQYHQWQGVPGTGDTFLFEVSTTNDDHVDNRFYVKQDRIPNVEEDEKPRYLMFADYNQYVSY